MQKWLIIVCFGLFSAGVFAQDTLKIYTWKEVQNANPDTIFAITAEKLKWDSVPVGLYKFVNLKYLNVSHNKLKSLPNELSVFTRLNYLNATRNKISNVPLVICQLTRLKTLMLGRNEIASLPECIGYLTELRKLDIWDNPINVLPPGVLKLEKLTAVDMRGILLSPSFQNKWKTSMPNVTWYFDAPCNCVE